LDLLDENQEAKNSEPEICFDGIIINEAVEGDRAPQTEDTSKIQLAQTKGGGSSARPQPTQWETN
jgi:hypothetical protein